VVRRIRALIHPQTQNPPTPAEWADFAHVGESGVYTEPDTSDTRHREPDAGYYDTAPIAPARGRGLGPAIVTVILVIAALVATWFFYGGTLTGTPRPTSVAQGSSATAPAPPPDHLTKVQVGPVAPADVEKMTAQLIHMGFEPFPKREGGEVYLQIGAFANADGAKQAQSELRAAGLPFRVQ
jgi:cell division septation protein DedD